MGKERCENVTLENTSHSGTHPVSYLSRICRFIHRPFSIWIRLLVFAFFFRRVQLDAYAHICRVIGTCARQPRLCIVLMIANSPPSGSKHFWNQATNTKPRLKPQHVLDFEQTTNWRKQVLRRSVYCKQKECKCMYGCTFECTYACMHAWIDGCVYVCMYVSTIYTHTSCIDSRRLLVEILILQACYLPLTQETCAPTPTLLQARYAKKRKNRNPKP